MRIREKVDPLQHTEKSYVEHSSTMQLVVLCHTLYVLGSKQQKTTAAFDTEEAAAAAAKNFLIGERTKEKDWTDPICYQSNHREEDTECRIR